MLFNNAQELVGKTVLAKSRIETDLESEIDPGMILVVLSVGEVNRHGLVTVKFDANPHLEHNYSRMQKNYYNQAGEPCLTAKDAGFWPKDNIIEEVFFAEWEVEMYFDIKTAGADIGRFGEQYLATKGKDQTYVQWLEEKIAANIDIIKL